MNRTRGFTLIELLIVVAIIGVLAAIAVPNMLQAQVRAQIARVVADHKNLSTAIETYRLDYNLPPPSPRFAAPRIYNFAERLTPLTTPTAYLSGIPTDPFPKRSSRDLDQSIDYRFEVPGAFTYGYFRSDHSGPGGQYDYGRHRYMITSSGPDGLILYLAYYPQTATESEDLCAVCNIQTPSIQLIATVYHPSNGLISRGDIIRWGGGHR